MNTLKEVRIALGLDQRELGELLEISSRQAQQYISHYETGKREMNDKFYKKFMDKTGIDLKKTLQDHTLIVADREKFQALNKGRHLIPGVPVFDIAVSAGVVPQIRDEPGELPAFYLQMPLFRDCVFGARVSGDSMYPEIRNGDYVVCKEILSKDSIIYGDIYLIITHDGVETVKHLHPHEKEDWVMLVPFNKSVPPTPMPRKNIARIFKVKGVIKGY